MEGAGGEVSALERPRCLANSSSVVTPLTRPLDRGCRNTITTNNNNTNNNNTMLGGPAAAAAQRGVGEGGCGSGGSSGGSGGGAGLLSPLEEAEEWARINDIMASFGGGLARESVFMAELEQEFQTRLGLSLSPSQQGLGILSGGGVGGVVAGGVGGAGTAGEAGGDRTAGAGGGSERTTTTTTDEGGAGGAGHEGTGVDKTVGGWLRALGLPQYEDVFVAHGYDDINFMNGGILEAGDLRDLGITQLTQQQTVLEAVSRLPVTRLPQDLPDTVEAWVESIRLPQYTQNFHKNGFGDMERVRKVWEIELTTVLEITRPGHRKRILASLGDRPLEPQLPPALNPHDLSLELSKLSSCSMTFLPLRAGSVAPPETATNTIRRSGTKKRSAPQPPAKAPRAQPSLDVPGGTDHLSNVPPLRDPSHLTNLSIRDPSQLVVGAPNTTPSNWRHHPNTLVTASVQYVAQYLGSTHVKELQGTDSTMRSIQKLRKAQLDIGKAPRIVLSVSYRGVRFMDAVNLTLVCEHEIRNIHCACQDADDLSHFAYITKDLQTKGHYCHVFRVQSRDLATEIILTLGEAFEVAYQLALREQPYTTTNTTTSSNQSDEQKLAYGGHTRSKSEHLRGTRSLSNGSAHTRSHSTVPQQVSIGGVSSSSAENLLSDSGNGSEKECGGGSRRDSLSSITPGHTTTQMNGS
ncbi:hypothetical protein Pmani_039509 [Petrolisthes manimaculis]|uniref:Ankyrin repeat and sterile alpha motif domain-containing protein 1B n=1 Tax=Petrolisthes manimaculis TaxID=1843537 RepID=A0AAE1NCD1_9EUCA|nr:hypothetical protein Pmani_039509 [Petrolisthes manimaculis]